MTLNFVKELFKFVPIENRIEVINNLLSNHDEHGLPKVPLLQLNEEDIYMLLNIKEEGVK